MIAITYLILILEVSSFTCPQLKCSRNEQLCISAQADFHPSNCQSTPRLNPSPSALFNGVRNKLSAFASLKNDHTLEAHEDNSNHYLEETTSFIEDTENSISEIELSIISESSKSEKIDIEDNNTTLQLFGMSIQSVVLLNFVAVFWGTQHSVIKMVVADGNTDMDSASAAAFTLARFGIASIVASPFTPSILPVWQLLKLKMFPNSEENLYKSDVENGSIENFDEKAEDSVMAWRWGLELGLWMFLGYAFQAVGLQYTTASKSGFILYLNVKFVPFLARIILGRQIS